MSIRSGCGKAAQVAPTLGYRPVCFDKLQNGPDPQGATRDRDRPAKGARGGGRASEEISGTVGLAGAPHAASQPQELAWRRVARGSTHQGGTIQLFR